MKRCVYVCTPKCQLPVFIFTSFWSITLFSITFLFSFRIRNNFRYSFYFAIESNTSLYAAALNEIVCCYVCRPDTYHGMRQANDEKTCCISQRGYGNKLLDECYIKQLLFGRAELHIHTSTVG